MELPLRKDLKPKEGEPEDSAWIWGENDQLGRLNLQTCETVKQAMSAAKHGEVIPLNLEYNKLSPPCFSRQPLNHKIVALAPFAFDETLELNPQSSSQWDGFRHFGHIATGLFYNKTMAEDIQGPNASHKCGVQAWAEKGIAGRGLLLDYARYAEENNISPSFYDAWKISFADLQAVAQAQGLDLRPERDGGDVKVGDILFIRSGFLKHSLALAASEREELHKRPNHGEDGNVQRYIGLEQSDEMCDFLHDSYFSAAVGDQPALEAWPSSKDYWLHEKLLALWGCPIGELWDLERLAESCAAKKQWTFFVTSAPNNVNGGIGSTSNALAIL
jgi:hypothetical protein